MLAKLSSVDSDLLVLPWRLDKRTWYVYTTRRAVVQFNPAEPALALVAGRKVYMHQVVLYRHAPVSSPEVITDHANGLRWDNTRENIRGASRAFNNANSIRKMSKSGFRGVYQQNTSGKFIASISINGKNQHLGLYDNPEDAALAYNQAAILRFGEFATLNELS